MTLLDELPPVGKAKVSPLNHEAVK
jgi:hypothetical protein